MYSNRPTRQVRLVEPSMETTPLVATSSVEGDSDDGSDMDGSEYYDAISGRDNYAHRRESIAADRLSERLLAIDDDDDEMEDLILHETLNVDMDTPLITRSERGRTLAATEAKFTGGIAKNRSSTAPAGASTTGWDTVGGKFFSMSGLCTLAFSLITALLWISTEFIGPPNQPVGPYELIERQEGDNFFGHYTFYEGPDSVGSNGYVTYVAEQRAKDIAIANIEYEVDELDGFYRRNAWDGADREAYDEESITTEVNQSKKEPFLYLKTAPTEAGPRESIRLEGKKRFNRGLFIIDVRHMPVGCGTWPAFWLTDEANWPVNGEIDIVEGVNFQTEAKTALHTTKGCDMDDTPVGTMTGTWDTAVGIPDRKTGIPDMTFRQAKNCFVYDPHQWLNQGCVAIDNDGGSLGIPLNEKGGGIFALEWDPAYRHIRTWVFAPHTAAPENLVEAIRTAGEESEEDRVAPNTELWSLPYGYFPIGDQTNCEKPKFRNMHLVLNTALCGSVAGNRFFLDCKNESKTFKSCDEYIKSRPEILSEAYWKIRGVYVYQRQWQKAWLGH